MITLSQSSGTTTYFSSYSTSHFKSNERVNSGSLKQKSQSKTTIKKSVKNQSTNNKRRNTTVQTSTTSQIQASTNSTLTATSSNLQYITTSTNISSTDINKKTTSNSSVNRNGGIDTVVVFSGKDTISYSVKMKKMRLKTDANVTYSLQKIHADALEISFEDATLNAYIGRDSSGKPFDPPKFADKNQEFYGEKIVYNFKTRKGAISMGETTADNGFFFGNRVKRVDDNTLFIEDGCYTTCSESHPHFYFKAPKMKVIAGDKVFADNMTFYVSDIPLLTLPFGLFFENKSGRRSGILVPTFRFLGAIGSQSRGIIFEKLGYYWAVSDYFDTQLDGDITTKGGFTIRSTNQYAVRDVVNGSISMAYGLYRPAPDADYSRNWSLNIAHNQTLDPTTSIGGSVFFASQDFNRNTQFDINQRIQQNIRSNFSFRTSYDNGIGFSVNYSRDQNLINGQLTEVLPTVSLSVPQLFPLKKIASRDSWIGDIALNYGLTGTRTYRKIATSRPDSFFVDNTASIRHSPSINISPKLGYFTIQPQINYKENWYFRRLTRVMRTSDSSLADSFENGFYREYEYSFGIGVSTRLYGIVKPNLLGISALRHTFQPTLSYNISPNFSRNSDMFGTYQDLKTGKNVLYSRFVRDGGGVNSVEQQNIRLSLSNNFDAKYKKNDTLDENLQLLNIDAGLSYNFAADSLKWSDIAVNFRTGSVAGLNFNGDAQFTLYDQDIVKNNDFQYFNRVNRLLVDAGKGVARLTSIGFSLQTSFSGKGLQSVPTASPLGSSFGNQPFGISTNTTSTLSSSSANITNSKDSLAVGNRFLGRLDTTYRQADIFGDQSSGWSDVNIPWNLSFFFSYRYSEPNPGVITRNVNISVSGDFAIAQAWRIRGGFSYDFIASQFNVPTIDIARDLSDCWELAFQWTPIGFSRGFYLRIAPKAGQLRDLKLDKRDNPLTR